MGQGFFQDDKGNFSMYRLVLFMVVLTFCVSYLAVTFANLFRGTGTVTLVDVGVGVIGVLTLFLTGKEVQKVIENKGGIPPGGGV